MASRQVSDYPELQKVLEGKEKIVYLCGAGASIALGGHHNTWWTWLQTGKSYLVPEQRNTFDTIAGSLTSHELIEAATYLLENLKKAGSYSDFMGKTIGSLHPSNQLMSYAFQKTCRIGDIIATTNYDRVLEEAVGKGYVTYETPGEILRIISGTAENRIVHLHGVYDKATAQDDIIADGEQYRTILENDGAQFIQNLLSTHPLIIVGCGGTVSDPNLSGFMQFAADKLELTVPYFYLMKEGDTIPDLPVNALPIYYGSEYDDLPDFLDKVSSHRLRNQEDMKGLVLIDPYADPQKLPSAFGRMYFANQFSSFTGRQAELDQLKRFLIQDKSILWWGVIGDGGIGKSRLILEWLKSLPSNWYGFFARKAPERFARFTPFTDTVIVLDSLLGEEELSVRTVTALMERFWDSPYRLRLLLVEREQADNMEDWLADLYKLFSPEDRIHFEACRYLNGAEIPDEAVLMALEPFNDEDELCYIQHYLKSYIPAFLKPADAQIYLSDLNAIGKTIQKLCQDLLEDQYRGPLYLSIFAEVWINKAGDLDIKGVKQLLKVYFEKEIDRWKALLKDDKLVNYYLRLLAMACAIGRFNITDVQGTNFLQQECTEISAFFDEQDIYPGTQNIFGNLFVEQDELEEFDPEDSFILKAYQHMSRDNGFAQDESFAFLAPYLKLEVDPEEFYLHMLNGAGISDETAGLAEIKERESQKLAAIPDHAWIIVPAFPDIIKEYVVLYTIKVSHSARFAKLARANSVFEFGHFLARAIEDWPAEQLFQEMLRTPPENVLEYFEFYMPWLTNARNIIEFEPIENVLLQGKAVLLFARYEMELWLRIAVVLTEREKWESLLNSAIRFTQYVWKNYDHPRVQERVVEVFNAYAVGIHNSGQAEKLSTFLDKCDKLASTHRDNEQLALFCCDCRGKLIHLWRYLEQTEQIMHDWNIVLSYLELYQDNENICLSAVSSADEYFSWLRRSKKYDCQHIKDLETSLESVFDRFPLPIVAELLAVVTANLYMAVLDKSREHSETLFQKVQRIFRQFPRSKRIQSAYASVCGKKYALKKSRACDVPSKLIKRLEKWNIQHPEDIEFREAYFDIMLFHLGYTREHGHRNEEIRIFHELEQISRNANYAEYQEKNRLEETVDLLRNLFGY